MNTQEESEKFLKEFLDDIHKNFSSSKNIEEFENLTIEWLNFLEDFQFINLKKMMEFMKNHQKNDLWFSSLIGFFYQHGIGKCEVNKNKALESYLLAIDVEKEENLNHFNGDLKKYNNIIGKYLLALYYYKEIILNKRNSFNWVKQPSNKENFEFHDYTRGINKKVKLYLKSVKGDSNAQYILGKCYYDGKGTNKSERKAFEWYLKSAKSNSNAQYSLGKCY